MFSPQKISASLLRSWRVLKWRRRGLYLLEEVARSNLLKQQVPIEGIKISEAYLIPASPALNIDFPIWF